jgi:purine nucleoside permease
MIKDVPCASTEKAKKDMAENFDNAEWALRDPAVIKGSSVTGDNYWAGSYDEANARLIIDTYPMADPYVATEMEDIAVAVTADRTGLMNRLIILRNIVNMDVYEKDMTPEKRWGAASDQVSDDSDDSDDGESLFNVSMENNFNVGRVIVDAILNGEL